MRRHIIDYGWLIGLAIVAIGLGFFMQYKDTSDNYTPIKANNIEFLTLPPFNSGQEIHIKNGLCNTTDKSVQIIITSFGFRETGDALTGRDISLVSILRNTMPIIEAKQCIGADVIGGLPPGVENGMWQLYYSVTVMGPQAGQLQRISRVSDIFQVR